MSTLSVALAHYRRRQALANAVMTASGRLWQQVDRADIAGSWLRLMPRALAALTAAQRAAAGMAPEYVAQVLREQGLPADVVPVDPGELAGIASDGRDLDTLLMQPAIAAKSALAGGVTLDQALNVGLTSLQLITSTQVQDAGRVADGVAITGQRVETSYVRMLVGRSCARCVILAGKTYGWNRGFQRHPHCDCIHVPYQEDVPNDVTTDPKAYFRSLPQREREQTFGKAGTQAIEDGADLNQVVNARRGVYVAGGRTLTREGTTRHGFHGGYRVDADGRLVKRARGEKAPPRLMPEEIYRQADGDRQLAQAMLRENGYVTDLTPRRTILPRSRLAAQVPEAARPFHRNIDGIENLANLVGDVGPGAERTKLSGGVSAATSLVRLPDGRRVVHKRALEFSSDAAEVAESVRSQADAEQLAALMGHALDAPVAKVYRTEADAVWMEYIAGAEDLSANAMFELVQGRDGIRLGLLDVLAANSDRNSGNLLARNGQMFGIDHGWAWGGSGVPEMRQTVVGWADRPIWHFVNRSDQYATENPLHRDDIDVIHGRLEALRPDFDRLGRGQWLDYSLKILHELRPFARGTERLYA